MADLIAPRGGGRGAAAHAARATSAGPARAFAPLDPPAAATAAGPAGTNRARRGGQGAPQGIAAVPHRAAAAARAPRARGAARAPSAPLRRCPDLSVAVVSYRSLDLLLDSARTWRDAAAALAVGWRVVENGTGEPVGQRLRAVHPGATVIALERSVSFAKANNIALRGCRGRHVALLNPDTLLEPGSLAELVRFLDANPHVGIVGPRVWDDPAKTSLQRSWRRFPSLATAVFNRHSLASRLWPANPWTARYLNLDRPEETQATDWVSGCCMVVRGELFRELGGLDQRYPMFCEDVDLCRAAASRGYTVAYHPAAQIVHLVGGSRRRAPLRSEWLRHRSMTHYVLKYHRRWNPLTWLLVAGIWTRFLAHGALAARRR
jgi:GT2 family glycosyltransferase